MNQQQFDDLDFDELETVLMAELILAVLRRRRQQPQPVIIDQPREQPREIEAPQPTFTDVVIPTAEQCRDARRPYLDVEFINYKRAMREAAAEEERRRKQEEFVLNWERQRYPLPTVIVLDQHGVEYVLDSHKWNRDRPALALCTPQRNVMTGGPSSHVMTRESVGDEYIDWPATYERWDRKRINAGL